jgi:5'-nucleotidase
MAACREGFDWSGVECVVLDMDGTLLDLNFDNRVWNDRLPRSYAAVSRLDYASAYRCIRQTLDAARGTLPFYCLDHWSKVFGIDLHEIERELARFIRIRPGVAEFLAAVRARGVRLVLATNAHPLSLARKLARTGLGAAFDVVVSAHDFGYPKEHDRFWENLHEFARFTLRNALFIDDNPAVLDAARRRGMRHLFGIAHPDSHGPRVQLADYHCLESFAELRS